MSQLKRRVARDCAPCQLAQATCDRGRPCSRCQTFGHVSQCRDDRAAPNAHHSLYSQPLVIPLRPQSHVHVEEITDAPPPDAASMQLAGSSSNMLDSLAAQPPPPLPYSFETNSFETGSAPIPIAAAVSSDLPDDNEISLLTQPVPALQTLVPASVTNQQQPMSRLSHAEHDDEDDDSPPSDDSDETSEMNPSHRPKHHQKQLLLTSASPPHRRRKLLSQHEQHYRTQPVEISLPARKKAAPNFSMGNHSAPISNAPNNTRRKGGNQKQSSHHQQQHHHHGNHSRSRQSNLPHPSGDIQLARAQPNGELFLTEAHKQLIRENVELQAMIQQIKDLRSHQSSMANEIRQIRISRGEDQTIIDHNMNSILMNNNNSNNPQIEYYPQNNENYPQQQQQQIPQQNQTQHNNNNPSSSSSSQQVALVNNHSTNGPNLIPLAKTLEDDVAAADQAWVVYDLTKRPLPIAAANATFCRMLGYDEAEVVGQPWKKFVHAESFQRTLHILQARAESAAALSSRIELPQVYVHKNGGVFATMDTHSIVVLGGTPVSDIVSIRLTPPSSSSNLASSSSTVPVVPSVDTFDSTRSPPDDLNALNPSNSNSNSNPDSSSPSPPISPQKLATDLANGAAPELEISDLTKFGDLSLNPIAVDLPQNESLSLLDNLPSNSNSQAHPLLLPSPAAAGNPPLLFGSPQASTSMLNNNSSHVNGHANGFHTEPPQMKLNTLQPNSNNNLGSVGVKKPLQDSFDEIANTFNIDEVLSDFLTTSNANHSLKP